MSTKVMSAYCVRSYQKDGEDKNFWTRIGTVKENRDGSLNAYLSALPIGDKIQIRAKTVNEADAAVLDEETNVLSGMVEEI